MTSQFLFSRKIWAALALLLLFGLFFQQLAQFHANSRGHTTNPPGSTPTYLNSRVPADFPTGSHLPRTPEEIVAHKVLQFAANRREILDRLSKHHGQEIPAEILEFFEAVKAGRWDEIDRRFQAMAKRSGQYEGSTHDPTLNHFWPAVLETYGVAEQAHLWPAQELLDYSQAVLGSLRPGMVYIGGTDAGRFIPTLVNETSSTEQHIILTQNALADNRYQDYAKFLYGERLNFPTQADRDQFFADYVADATRRFEHDDKFPNEPKQVRPGEEIQRVEGKIAVSGRVAVFDINQRIVQSILEKNPDLSFALQESIPLTGTYAQAQPLGPIMELNAAAHSPSAPPENQSAQLLDYWRTRSSELLANPQANQSSETMVSWAHLLLGQANLLAHQQSHDADEAYRLVLQMSPRHTDGILNYSQYLHHHGRAPEARQLVHDFTQKNPDLAKDLHKFLPQNLAN